jgi:hypothetical protein
MLEIALVVIIALMFLGAVGSAPVWPHSRAYGYAPVGLLGTIVLVLLILFLLRRL